MAQRLYWLWRLHHVSPADLMSKGEGERRILLAFARHEMEELAKESAP